MANLLVGNSAENELFNTSQYNRYKSENNENTYIEKESNSLNLKRVFFITSDGSASASELLINGIKPYIEVILIGKNTHGKPVGMRTFRYKDMVAAFITFKGINANNEGDYYNGIPIDAATRDGLEKEFGDPEEDCLKQAYYYIENNAFMPTLKSATKSSTHKKFEKTGFDRIVGFD